MKDSPAIVRRCVRGIHDGRNLPHNQRGMCAAALYHHLDPFEVISSIAKSNTGFYCLIWTAVDLLLGYAVLWWRDWGSDSSGFRIGEA
jgi:hypothetical protein